VQISFIVAARRACDSSERYASSMFMTTLVAAMALAARSAPPAQQPQQFEHVLVISVDGLRPDAIDGEFLAKLPAFARLERGPHTLDARNDPDITVTLPNHVSMVTGRLVKGERGHGWTINDEPPGPKEGGTVHAVKGAYVASMFDVAHDEGLSTCVAAGKTKFWLFVQSYSWTGGAPDTVPPDYSPAKIDAFLYEDNTEALAGAVTDRLRRSKKRTLDFVHFAAPDVAGHSFDWIVAPDSKYFEAVKEVDRGLQLILDAIDADEHLRGKTAIVLTADHGGGVPRKTHTDNTCPLNFRVPFLVWLGADSASVDLVAINPERAHPARDQTVGPDEAVQPIRNADAANVALRLLHLGPVPGSFVGASAPLHLANPVSKPAS